MSDEAKKEVEQPKEEVKVTAKEEAAPKKEEVKKEEPKKEEVAAAKPAEAATAKPVAAAAPKAVERIKASNCTVCNKVLKRGMWYYRNGKYFCAKRCWKKSTEKVA